ncbi:MAG: bacillithiol system redox-active protein YtxJ [Bacteroidetes bacterium]|nr:bacillithiol system redox-active protein YtxJ [Bacteroidota bacterium]MBS1592333.1 bacillithiol system redox-active protein YtxJ [Bacteroidota bacterium]
MNWTPLSQIEQLQHINQQSFIRPQIIFKHSTRCSISKMAFNRLEKFEIPSGTDFYYLDLLAHRNISNTIAELYKTHHESPQILIIKNGKCVYTESHSGINANDIIHAIFSAN